jgi:predicted GH43/DUF377 family glycosyl hydrolase
MPEYLLFYAGDDKRHEQIGLARSHDGVHFERVGDGLIVPVAPAVPWRDLRTCNPAVIRVGGRLEMFFQGISRERAHVSIARAVSSDTRGWQVAAQPCISWRDLAEHDPGQAPQSHRAAAFEPSVLLEDGRYRMWFLYFHAPTHPSNSLFYAESGDGEQWEIRPQPLLSGDSFGFCLFHYPQVLPTTEGYELFFTLRSRRTLVDGIYRLTSADGFSWGGLEPILRRSFRTVRSKRNIAAKAFNRLIRLPWPKHGRNVLGYSHPHVLPSETPPAMYIHNDHHGPRGRWHDISRLELHGRRWTASRTVLGPASDPGAWDSHFVADPYVIVT